MMKYLFALCLSFLIAYEASAATLTWDAQLDSNPLTVERSATQPGPYAPVATLPGGTTSYILTPGAYGWYRVRNSAGPSNVVQFSLDLYTGPVTQRLDVLEARLSAIESTIRAEPWDGSFMVLNTQVTELESRPQLRLFDGNPPIDTQRLSCVEGPVNTVDCYRIILTTEAVVTPPPAPTSNLTVRQIDADHIEITCNGIGISTTGSGKRRLMECRH